MSLERAKKHEQKQGLLALGLKQGEGLPFLKEAGVENRVNKEGRVEWIIRDPVSLLLDSAYAFRSYIAKKEDQVYRDIFKGWRYFWRALMGFSVPSPSGRWIRELGIVELFPTQPSATKWEEAPWQIQKMARELSIAEYLKPQLG